MPTGTYSATDAYKLAPPESDKQGRQRASQYDDDNNINNINNINNNNNSDSDNDDDNFDGDDDCFSETFSDGGAAGVEPHTASTEQEESIVKDELGLNEARWVFRSKLLVALVLLIAASACAVITFIVTADEDIEDFENQFDDYAHEILEVSQITASSVFAILRTISTTVTSHSIDKGDADEWPNVTIPHFEARASEFLTLSGALYLSLSPILKPNQRTEWEEYARQNQDWIRDGLQYNGVDETTTNNDTSNLLANDFIFSFDKNNQVQPARIEITTHLFAPIWQLAPITRFPNLVNYDLFDYESFPAAFLLMIQSGDVSMSQARNLEVQENSDQQTSKFSWPQSFLLAPVVKHFVTRDNKGKEIVAILTSLIPWHFFFENILPDGADGIHIVLQNTCDQVFTYVTQSSDLLYLGPGDLHEDEYTSNGITLDVYFGTQLSVADTHVLDESCLYTVTAYPSEEFFGPHDSNKPQIYMVLVVMIFVLTTCVFVVYDRFVQQRQEKVFNTAVQSSAIVSSLFPAQVRRRLMEEAAMKAEASMKEKGIKNYKKRGNKSSASNSGINNRIERRNSFSNDNADTVTSNNGFFASAAANFMDNGAGAPSRKILAFALPSTNNNTSSSYVQHSAPSAPMHQKRDLDIDAETEREKAMLLATKPIADLFPQATVLFADISGFTAWSSVREPSQVFILLEQIYGTFDGIAKRRKIFKVETIGDCYVAACGLPTPRDDHAEAMVKFANECCIKMVQVVGKLEVLLGPDTADLACRFGIHSGPVTAGVLRGDKTRFQLFGDTVNTASRVETLGERNMIHLSESTAKILIDTGKGNWVQKRKELVSAKGKGKMQTYWLTMPQQAPASLSVTFSGTTNSSSCDGFMKTDGGSLEFTRKEKSKNSKLLQIKQQQGQQQQQPCQEDDTKQRYSSVHEQNPKEQIKDIKQPHQQEQAKESIQPAQVSMTSLSSLLSSATGQASSSSSSSSSRMQQKVDTKVQRLVEWNVDVLKRLLIQVIQQRNSYLPKSRSLLSIPLVKQNSCNKFKVSSPSSPEKLTIDEAVEYISMPLLGHNHNVSSSSSSSSSERALMTAHIKLSPDVVSQLRDYVTKIALLYPSHQFHSFVHASHVTQSVAKLLSRIIASDDGAYGIANDSLTHFACVFSALIHDVDHPGVTNASLVKEQHPLAVKYQNRSVAEQNSIDVAWNLLMEDKYDDLCSCIYTTQEELDRFRQIVVTSVLATDIMDKSLGEIRQRRWEIAFRAKNHSNKNQDGVDGCEKMVVVDDIELTNRKATCVIELLLQASDISHTMQHWHVYSRWNRALFQEMYKAFMDQRISTDPSVGWYKGEIGFYDFYIIPLARKLKESGVFGVSSDEYLAYALANRQEWLLKGEEIVKNVYLSS